MSDGSGYSNFGRRVDPGVNNIPYPMAVPEPIENPVQPVELVPHVVSAVATTPVELLSTSTFCTPCTDILTNFWCEGRPNR